MSKLIEAAKAILAHERAPHPNGWFARERGVVSAMVPVSPTAIAALRAALADAEAARKLEQDVLGESSGHASPTSEAQEKTSEKACADAGEIGSRKPFGG